MSGRERELLFEPGTQYAFSSYGWILVSAAVEAAAEERLLTYMEKQIFDPLGMDDTVPDSAIEPIPNRATSYFPRFAADPRYGLHLTRPLNYSCFAGSSVFLSTPSDLVRFGMAINSGKRLKPATVQLLQTRQRLASGEETGYGLGWDLETVELAGTPTRWVGHDGMLLGGMVASLMTFPERGIIVSVMSNISYSDTETVALKIAQAFVNGAGVQHPGDERNAVSRPVPWTRRRFRLEQNDHWDGERFINATGTAGQPFSKVPRMLREPRTPWPPHIDVRPQVPPELNGALATVTFIGHSTFLIQTAAGNILTDPMYSQRASPLSWIGPKRVRQPGVRFDDLPTISMVLLSHNHYDHCDLPTLRRLAKRFDPVVVTLLGNGRLVRSAGIRRVEELDWWQHATGCAFRLP